MGLTLRPLGKKLWDFGSRVVDQANTGDNNRTYKQRIPTDARPAIQQLTHNGLTNVVGHGVIQPLIRTSMALNQGIGNAELALAGRPTKTASQYFDQRSGLNRLRQSTNYTGVKRQVAGDIITNVSNVAAPGSSKLLESGVARVLPKVIPKIVPKVVSSAAVGAPVGAVSNTGMYLSGDAPVTSHGIAESAKQGAAFGAVGGAILPIAGAASRTAARAAVPVVRKGAKQATATAKQIDRKVFSPRVNLNEQRALSDMSDYLVGVNKGRGREISQTIAVARQAGRRHGIDITQGPRSQQLEAVNSVLDQIGQRNKQIAQGGYVSVPGGKPRVSLKANGSPVQPTIADLAGARPYAELQKRIENAHNAGDTVTVAELITQVPAQDQSAMRSALGLPVANAKQRGFVTSVKSSPNISIQVKEMTQGAYQSRSTAGLQRRAEQFAGGDLTLAKQDLTQRLDVAEGKITDGEVADTIALAKRLDDNGDFESASGFYDKLAMHLTKLGQSVQAAAILSRRTPEGLRYSANKQFRKAGVDLTPETQAQLNKAISDFGKTAPNSPERDYAAKMAQKIVADNIPSSLADKLASTWKAGLLTGVKTQTGNWLSNTTFGALHAASNPLAVAIDKAIGIITHQRTKALTTRGLVGGTIEGAKRGAKYIKTGIDERASLTNKYEGHDVVFKSQAMNVYVNGVFRIMGAADRPAYYSQLRNSLNDLAIVDGKNLGLRGRDLQAHIRQFTDNPPSEAFQTATNEAEKGVLANDTALSRIIGGARNSVNGIDNKLARGTASVTMSVLAPFTKVPSAFLSRVIDFTPVGAVKQAALQIASKRLDQRALATALSESAAGTAVVYLGYQAAKHGLLSGDYPNDPKEQQRWKAEGIQPNSIRVGNTWLSLNYFGPIGMLFGAGKRVNDIEQQGEGLGEQSVGAAAGLPKDLLGQSFLQGLSGFTNAVNDPKRSAKSYVNSQAGSVVPTIIGDVANATDQFQRQSDTPGQAIQGRIPGARQRLLKTQDVYGNKLDRKTTSESTLINPLRPSDQNSNPVIAEVARLHAVNPNNKDIQVTPTPVDKSAKFDGVQVKLSDKKRYELQSKVGQATQSLWGELIRTPEYKLLSDTEKANALNGLRQDITVVKTQEFAADNKLGRHAPSFSGEADKLSARQLAIAAGKPDLAVYTKASSPASPPGVTAKRASTKKPGKRRGGTAHVSKAHASTKKLGNRHKGTARVSKKAAGSLFKYAVSIGSGGSAPRPRVRVKKSTKARAAKKSIGAAGTLAMGRPVVSVKKSLV